MITVAENVQIIVIQIYLYNGIYVIPIIANLTKCTTVQETVTITSEIMLWVISQCVLLIIVKLLKKTEHAKFVSNLIMLWMEFVLTKDHVSSIIHQRVNVESAEKGIIWYQVHAFLKTAHLTVRLMSVHVCNAKEDTNWQQIKRVNLNFVNILVKTTPVHNV